MNYSKKFTCFMVLSIFFLLFVIGKIECQVNKSYIQLKSNALLSGKKVEILKNNESYDFIIDSVKTDANLVRYFNKNRVLFANTGNFDNEGYPEFAQRIIAGKINYYEKYNNLAFPFIIISEESRNKDINVYSSYINKGNEDLQKATYQNILLAVLDDQNSYNMTKDAIDVNEFSWVGISIGTGIALTSTILRIIDSKNEKFEYKNFKAHTVISIYLVVGFTLFRKAIPSKKEIIENYNLQ